MNLIPAHAEQIDFSTVFKTRRAPSRLVPGLQALVPYLVCPACQAEHDQPAALDRLDCRCGLSMQTTHAGFFIWRDAPSQAAE